MTARGVPQAGNPEREAKRKIRLYCAAAVGVLGRGGQEQVGGRVNEKKAVEVLGSVCYVRACMCGEKVMCVVRVVRRVRPLVSSRSMSMRADLKVRKARKMKKER